MQTWALLLAQTPPTLQRLIAATQRISLPRGCSAAERLARLRAALCRRAAVQRLYFLLTPEEQAAVQALRALRGGLDAPTLTLRLGPLRALSALAADREPRSLSERLLLLGWLLPRPTLRQRPPRYLVPAELRRWLPTPLPLPPTTLPPLVVSPNAQPAAGAEPLAPLAVSAHPAHGREDVPSSKMRRGQDALAPRFAPYPNAEELPLQVAAQVPAVWATTALLVAAALHPLPLQSAGHPTASALRLLVPRLAPLAPPQAEALVVWLLPLLGDLGLFGATGTAALPSPTAGRFLAQTPAQRRHLLTDAWLRAPRPDPWFAALRVNRRGLDWPALRRRLLAWATALPPYLPQDPRQNYALLAAALGPLADADTHGFSASPRRAPWLPHRAVDVWAAAWHGPLHWLGATAQAQSVATPQPDAQAEHGDAASPSASEWRFLPAGNGEDKDVAFTIAVDDDVDDADQLTLAPFVAFLARERATTSYQLTPKTLALGRSRGHDAAPLLALLRQHCAALPARLAQLFAPTGDLQLLTATLLLSDRPADLRLALRRRAVRQTIQTQLAPGVALVKPAAVTALCHALARDGRAVVAPPPPAPEPTLLALRPDEVATLLVAAHFYQTHAPRGAPLGPPSDLIARLRASLPPDLLARSDAALAALGSAAPWPQASDAAAVTPPESAGLAEQVEAHTPPTIASLLSQLHTAIRRRQVVALCYQGAQAASARQRTVRPLRIERHARWWYLHAYCLSAQAERCFRLDRVQSLQTTTTAAPSRRPPGPRTRPVVPPRPHKPRRAAQGFFSTPPDPAPGHPLVRIWLSDE
ncbi:MAG: WYL domain-containing protein [Candidatus Viridilinea halotolerans]|uniref:WYL domain-containing protein n=1 Tax=Candidatus Viridilinea halotolerans TaxID=2491704 RepID=A0A426TSA1_9CHLR|nr:MAG: WYL domain-containing protein [Candidatus Viridilinea halotolerans]